MDAGSHKSVLKVTAACLLGAVLLAILPDALTAQLRDLVRVALQPGQSAVLAVQDVARHQWAAIQSAELARRDRELQDLTAQVRSAEFDTRQATLALQSVQQQLDDARRNGVPRFPTQPTEPLLSSRAIEARIVGREILAGVKSRHLLDIGQGSGLRDDQWVLDAGQPVLDAGSDLAVRTGLPVFAGRCVVGRVAQTGRWTSSLQLITAIDFRARALVADSRGRLRDASPHGLLEGTGSGCRLTQVPTTEDIQVGDAVYSLPGFPIDAPMLFGLVSSRIRQPGALHWDIEVEPHVDTTSLRTVQVVIPAVNPQRLAERN